MLKKIASITLIFLLVSALAPVGGYAGELCLTRRIAYAPGEVIIKFQPGIVQMPSYMQEADCKYLTVNSASLFSLNKKYGLISMRRLSKSKNNPALENIYVLKFSDSIDVIKLTKEYSQDPNVVYARPNYILFYCA